MDIKKLSRIIAVIFIILVVGGLVLGLVTGASNYYKQKEATDALAEQGLSPAIVAQ